MPPYPNVDGYTDEETKFAIENFLNRGEFVLSENQRRFKKAMRRIRLCAMIKSFKQVIFNGPSASVDMYKHYSWCPALNWISHDQENNNF